MIAVKVENISKVYRLYDKPVDRLKESLHPLRKKYSKDFYALNNISFEVNKGETIGIIGKNGSGKSTILKIITGVLSPTSGKITTNGKISSLLELGAGFNPELTGLENIYLNGTIMGYSKADMDKKLDNILSFADIGDFVYQPVKVYSSGMFVRLAFSVAINVDPDILIVDEALSVGDIRFQIKCMEKFNEFREKGKTILFVSHDIHSIKKFCDKTIWLNDGSVQAIGETNSVTDMYLDYLRISEVGSVKEISKNLLDQSEQEEGKNELENMITKQPEAIGKIERVEILNEQNKPVGIIEHNRKIKVRVDFIIYDDTIKNIAIGVAIHRIDNFYICGLNTALDNFKVSWQKGNNTCNLHYDSVNLIGGRYYLDVALFEENAYVPIDYRTKIKTFDVKSDYVGEGIVILNHKWL